MKHRDRFGCNGTQISYVSLGLVGILACAAVLGQGSLNDVWATTIYSYIDDHGNPVYTDAPETIPHEYRAGVKTHERSGSVSKRSSVMDSVQRTVKEQAKSYGFKVPWFKSDMNRFSPSRVGILTYAGAAAIFLLVIMYFFKNSPLIRLLAFGLLIILGITTPVLIYSQEGGPMDVMKKKAVEAGQAQENRLQQVPQ